MTENRTGNGTSGSACRTVAVGFDDRRGVWFDSAGEPGEKVIELLSHDGRVTTIIQRPDGQLMVHTDALRAIDHVVRVAPDGTARHLPHPAN